ncbi:MAG: tyrosine phosphatase family protein [Bauldia sp.]
MPSIHVCSLSRLEDTVARSGARHLVTVINEGTPVTRPAAIAPERHLFLGFNDITEPMAGMILPAEAHIGKLLDFVSRWDRATPLLVHCYAGISRSTAGAFIALCAAAPDRDEVEIAQRLRRASPTAFPNPLMVRYADAILGRNGRMERAIAGIGPPTNAFEGQPFALPLRA